MKTLAGIAIAAATLTACASADNRTPGDPLEPLNRGVMQFNTVVDQIALGPASKIYETITPGFAREGVGNALSNLGQPVTAVNSLL